MFIKKTFLLLGLEKMWEWWENPRVARSPLSSLSANCCGSSIVSIPHFPPVFNQTGVERARHLSLQISAYHWNCWRMRIYFRWQCVNPTTRNQNVWRKSRGRNSAFILRIWCGIFAHVDARTIQESKCVGVFTDVKEKKRQNNRKLTGCKWKPLLGCLS